MMMYNDLIKQLRYCADATTCRNCIWKTECCPTDMQKKAADAIEELRKAVLRLEDESGIYDELPMFYIYPTKWIPVTERLPNCNGCYLVWRPHFFGGEIGMPSICYFDGSNTWHDSYGVDFTRILHSEDVTHWMPLPSAPMEE